MIPLEKFQRAGGKIWKNGAQEMMPGTGEPMDADDASKIGQFKITSIVDRRAAGDSDSGAPDVWGNRAWGKIARSLEPGRVNLSFRVRRTSRSGASREKTGASRRHSPGKPPQVRKKAIPALRLVQLTCEFSARVCVF